MNQPHFDLNQIVYLDVPESDCIGRIESFTVDPNGVTYCVIWNDGTGGKFFPCQLTSEKPPVVAEA